MIESFFMDDTPDHDKILSDMKRINEHFYLKFDESLIHNHLHQMMQSGGVDQKMSARLKCIGSGFWFTSYLIHTSSKSSKSSNNSTGQIVLNIPTRSPDNEEDSRQYSVWYQNMQRLKKQTLNIPLIPPFHLITHHQRVRAWVSPYGEPLSQSDPGTHWLPLTKHITRTQGLLAQNGLQIEDMIQIRCWNNIPFIHDLSDLILVEKSETGGVRQNHFYRGTSL